MTTFIKTFALIQSIEDISQAQMAFNYIENIFLFICLALAVLVMILIPVALSFSMIDNYFTFKKYGTKIDDGICCHKSHYNDKQIDKACLKYLKSYSGFMKNLSGLIAWNLFSLLYIAIAFADFKTGVLEYFNFPFQVINTFSSNDISNSFIEFSGNWYAMLIISVLTLVFFILGNTMGSNFGKSNLEKRELHTSLS